MKEIKKVCLYYRVSTTDQVENDTIELQRESLPKWAREQGWEVVAEYEDLGITGTKMESRPDFIEMLAQIRAGKYDACVTRHSDRLTRTSDLSEWGMIYGAFQQSDTSIASPYEGIVSLSDLSGQMMAFIRGRFSAEESKKTKERQREGIARKHRDGCYAACTIPFGISWDKNQKKWLRNEMEVSVLEEMVRLLKSGSGVRRISNTFNSDLEKFPSRRYLLRQSPNYKSPVARADRKRKPKSELWVPGTIWRLVNSDFLFTGEINAKAGVIDTGVRLFPRDEILQARHFMKQRTRKISKKTVVDPNTFLLRRIVKCGECDRFLSIRQPRNLYVCSKCGMEIRNADRIDNMVWNKIVSTFSDPEKLAGAVKDFEFIPDRTLADLQQDRKTSQTKLDGVSTGMERVNEMYAMDTRMTKDQYDKLYVSLEKQQAELRTEHDRITKTLTRSADLDDSIRNAATLISDQLQSAARQDEGTRQNEFSSATTIARDKSTMSAEQAFEQKRELINKLILADGSVKAWKNRIEISGRLLKDICTIGTNFNFNGVKMDIAHQFLQVRIFLTHDRFEAILE